MQCVSMQCVSDGGMHSYVWERKDDELPKNSQGAQSSNLTFINLRSQDSGEYRCILFNSTGRIASNYTLLTVKGHYINKYFFGAILIESY